jgi:hypothetical protein
MKPRLFTYDEARRSAPGGDLSAVAAWLADGPMSGHADLGRTGAVCPFLRKSAHFGTLRIGIHDAQPHEEERVFADIRASFAGLSQIPEPGGAGRLGTIIYGFPNCAGEQGVAMLARVYRRQKYYTLARSRMIAFFHAGSDTHGLWNPDFRPMRAVIPVLSTRFLTEHDAIFACKHRILTAPYLLRFGATGARKLAAARKQKPGARTQV